MAESEDDTDQNETEIVESTNRQNDTVVLLNRTLVRIQGKPSEAAIHRVQIENIATETVEIENVTPAKSFKMESDKDNDEIDFIVLEENSQESCENEIEVMPNKRIRLDEAIQQEKVVEIVKEKPKTAVKLNTPIAKCSIDGVVSSTETVDSNSEETYFALSLVGILKRLPPHKRAIAKCHILSYLTELEYGSSSLP